MRLFKVFSCTINFQEVAQV